MWHILKFSPIVTLLLMIFLPKIWHWLWMHTLGCLFFTHELAKTLFIRKTNLRLSQALIYDKLQIRWWVFFSCCTETFVIVGFLWFFTNLWVVKHGSRIILNSSVLFILLPFISVIYLFIYLFSLQTGESLGNNHWNWQTSFVLS